MSETPHYMQSYGCVKCQRTHYSDQPLFDQHVGWQSKHGVRTFIPDHVVADEREARQHNEPSPDNE